MSYVPLKEEDARPLWHALTVGQALHLLSSGREGLARAEAERRLRAGGPNALPEAPRHSVLAIVFAQLRSPLIALLLAAAAVSVLLGDHEDAVFILAVVLINTVIGAVQEYQAEVNTAALHARIHSESRVRRDGAVGRIDSRELVTGDVVLLEAGDRVPADLRLLEASQAQADESMLTGESLPVEKATLQPLGADTRLVDRANMLHAGTIMQRGRCEAVVVATGTATVIGQIARVLQAPSEGPPLIRRLDRFSRMLGLIAVGLVALVMAIQLVEGVPLRETLFLAIALAVSIIPEGLPVAVTVALSIATRRMARRHVIIRQLAAVEGLGSCTVVATDKTGTLTINRVTAERLWLPGHGEVSVRTDGMPGAALALAQAGALCNDATFDPDRAEAASGDAIDVAFLALAAGCSIDLGALTRAHPRMAELPFDAGRKFSASLNAAGEGLSLHVKGAADVIIPRCGHQGLTEAMRAAEAMAQEGYRVLAVASKHMPDASADTDPISLERAVSGLTLLGLVGFIDPLRPEARDAVRACRQAGVKVKMITGDHAATALSIARALGIAERAEEVITGREFDLSGTPDPSLARRLAQASVFARVEPAQKVAIVEGLQAAGEIVAMTGDGVNDAPALKRADLGIAMGRDGTDVARDVSDLVLTDDNFASIVAGIEEGRAAYANIRKVILLLISTGAAEAVMVILAVLTGLPSPLTAVQLLWLNLVTNGGQDVALAFEKKEGGLLLARPRSPGEPLFDQPMIHQVTLAGTYMGVIAYAVFTLTLSEGWSDGEARNITLFLMVMFQNFHVFNCRSETMSVLSIPLVNNLPLLFAATGAQLLHIAAPFIPFLRDVLQVTPITFQMWLLLVPLALSVVLVMEVDKAIRRRGRTLEIAHG